MSAIVNVRHTMIRSYGRQNMFRRRFTIGAADQQRQGDGSETRPPVYELRTYTVYPDKMREFLDLTAKEFHLRTAHSKLFGYWTSEIGGLNQVVHIWEYGSLSERAGVRARLAADSEWIKRYFSHILTMIPCQDNVLLTMIPGRKISLPSNNGVYELQTMQLHGTPAVWSKALLAYVQACEAVRQAEGSMVVGAWSSVLGSRGMAAVLWQHPTPDGCLSLAEVSATLPEGETLAPLVASGHSKLLLPSVVSPLQ
ncbi:protein NipSnap homolog 3A-like [Portunus trituberculatus]|uniref:protein NipSnap homolog 3A-like n=1 Tax=Portunus trituberculatus TaxID=210409 RepID=UPI001E1CDC31|nr:protein NipSnap homolog 3A-like [Portunus trituberculatus]